MDEHALERTRKHLIVEVVNKQLDAFALIDMLIEKEREIMKLKHKQSIQK